jgi:sRNA-binding carbon storage regulator CsrA
MLVLRRRAHEVIVFDGGLTLAVAELVDRHAWLAFGGPGIEPAVTIAPLACSSTGATIAVRHPAAVAFAGGTARVTLAEDADPDDRRATLLLETPVGHRIELGGLSLELTSTANGRAALGVDAACLPSRVTIAVHAVSGVEARIGIDAPPEIGVTREELWLEMLAANSAAARSPGSLRALQADPEPPTA